MNKNIEEFLNLPPLDDVLKEKGIDVEVDQEKVQSSLKTLRDLSDKANMLEGTDHAEAMDILHDEILKHARDLMDYGYNIDMPRQRGIFEIAAAMYGHAINTKDSKRDAQLKSLRLMLDQRKVDLEEKRTNAAIGIGNNQVASTDKDGTIIVEDRNELLKRLREQIKKD